MLMTIIKVIGVIILSVMAFKLIMLISNINERRKNLLKLIMVIFALGSSAIVVKVDNVHIDFIFGGKEKGDITESRENSKITAKSGENTTDTASSEYETVETLMQNEPDMEEILAELKRNGTPFCNLNIFVHELGMQTLDEKGNLMQEIGRPIEDNLCLELKMVKKDDTRITYDEILYIEYDEEFAEGFYILRHIPVGVYEYIAKVNGYQTLVQEIDIKNSLISGNAFFTTLNFEANNAKEFAPYTLKVVDGDFQQLVPEFFMIDYDGTIMQQVIVGIDGVIRFRAQLGEEISFNTTYEGREYDGSITLEKRGEEYYLQLQNDGTVKIKDYEDFLNK